MDLKTRTAGPAIDRAALLELCELEANPIDGDTSCPWDNWGSDKPLIDWHGVNEVDDKGRVRWLELTEKGLRGRIPEELGNLTQLRYLNLSKNELNGEIPKELGNLRGLHTLALNNNDLTGEIPAELGNIVGGCDNALFNLSCYWTAGSPFLDLYLQENRLEGEIPAALNNIGYLREMRTRPGNDELAGCLVPNRVLEGLRVSSGLLTNWAISTATKTSEAADVVLKLEGLLADNLTNAYSQPLTLLGWALGGFSTWISEVLSGRQDDFAQLIGLGNVEDVACN